MLNPRFVPTVIPNMHANLALCPGCAQTMSAVGKPDDTLWWECRECGELWPYVRMLVVKMPRPAA